MQSRESARREVFPLKPLESLLGLTPTLCRSWTTATDGGKIPAGRGYAEISREDGDEEEEDGVEYWGEMPSITEEFIEESMEGGGSTVALSRLPITLG